MSSPKGPSKLSSVILWSVISAAFIGPGTVTTAVAAGSQYGLDLLWTVTFSTLGCIALQELSARITIASGLTFGESLTRKFGVRQGRTLQWIVGGSVVLGCAAYEAGNILGAVAGLNLITGLSALALTIVVTAVAGVVLWTGGKKWISQIMMGLVVVMGIAFTALALSQDFSWLQLLRSSAIPVIPAGSELLILGLVGTTIVPYNIFIGSGISKGSTVPLMRTGLAISVGIGGMITAAILIAGVGIRDFSSFPQLAREMAAGVGSWGGHALALGLFAAGFSSAITSPWASSLIATTVFGFTKRKHIAAVWILVLLTGFTFGASGVRPIPVILAVQAINGLILPLVTLYLIVIVNDRNIVPVRHAHAWWYNIVLLVILGIVLVIGFNNIDKTIGQVTGDTSPHTMIVMIAAGVVVAYTGWKVFSK